MKKLLAVVLLVFSAQLALAEKKPNASKRGLASSTNPSVIPPSHNDSKHEIILGSTSADLLIGNSTQINFNVGYNYTVMPGTLQIGLLSALTYVSGGNGTTSVGGTIYQVVAGPTLNVPFEGLDFKNALFISAQAGILTGSASGSVTNSSNNTNTLSGGSTNFELIVALGKRFQIFDNLVYRPTLGLELIGGAAYFRATFLSTALIL